VPNHISQLHRAKSKANNEYLTKYEDVARELAHYHPSLFTGKAVILPANDGDTSAFWRYFMHNFEQLGLDRLQSIKYNLDGHGELHHYSKFAGHEIKTLESNGGFEQDDVRYLISNADIVVTNPPFSLMRQFIGVIKDMQYLILAPLTTLGYKEIVPLWMNGEMWAGADYYGKGGRRYYRSAGGEIAIKNTIWLTNMNHDMLPSRGIPTRPYAENVANFARRAGTRTWTDYPTYENFDAIECGYTENIPSDYDGVMGVPLSFLLKWNPSQFELVGFRKGNDGKDLRVDGMEKYQRVLIRHRSARGA